MGVLLLGLLAGGCGYTLGGNLPPHVKTVAVPVFKNLTQQPAIENVITSAVVNAFANGGRLKVVPLEQADSILEGEIVGYTVDSIAFDSSINAQVFRLRVRLNIQFRDVRNNTMLSAPASLVSNVSRNSERSSPSGNSARVTRATASSSRKGSGPCKRATGGV